MSTRVRVTLEVDAEFVRLLHANLTLSGIADPNQGKEVDVRGVLARIFCLEARGALLEQIHAATPHEWRGKIEVVEGTRETLKDGDTEWQKTA